MAFLIKGEKDRLVRLRKLTEADPFMQGSMMPAGCPCGFLEDFVTIVGVVSICVCACVPVCVPARVHVRVRVRGNKRKEVYWFIYQRNMMVSMNKVS